MGAYELSGFMHKTLLKPLPKAKKGVFGYFVRTDLGNLMSENIFNDFLDPI